jgi:mRNA-degrading endonuclease toxin of MazEF toxin-antitoxin module
LLIDQVRAVSNRRLLARLGALTPAQLERVQAALRLLTGA